MALIALLHRWAAAVDPQDVATALVLLAAGLVLAAGLLRGAVGFRRHLPALLLVIASESWMLLAALSHRPLAAWWPLGIAVAVLFAVQLIVWRPASAVAAEGSRDRAGPVMLLIVGVALSCLLLGFRLASSPGLLLTWEPTVVEGFGQSLRDGVGVGGYLADTVRWDDGLVSRGDHSLLYGAPTYALLRTAGFGVLHLRLFAAILAALVPLLAFGALRRFGPGVGAAAALALGLSVPLLYYGRYGTSLSGSLVGVLLAAWACWLFLDAEPKRWWIGLPAALAVVVATLGYSPGRLVVLALVALTATFTAVAALRGERRRLVGLAVFVAALAGFWLYQASRGADSRFVSARGEQILTFMSQEGYLAKYLGRPVAPDELTAGDRIELAGRMVAERTPEYVGVLARGCAGGLGYNEIIFTDPPMMPLFIPPLLPFLLLGVAVSLRRASRPEHATLLTWFALSSVPLLLTTRVDAHRMVFLTVPLAVWTALGLVESRAVCDAARIGKWLRRPVVTALIVLMAWMDAVLLFPPALQPAPLADAMIAEIGGLRGDVVLASIADRREVGLVDLALLERQRLDPARTSRLLPDPRVRALVDPLPDPVEIPRLVAAVGGGTLLMVPAEAFTETAGALREAGLEVTELGPPGSRFWRASGSAFVRRRADP